jgi:hypothetical protein
MPPYTALLAFLVALGQRHLATGRAELTATGEASGALEYPLWLVEIDSQGSETTPGLDTLTAAVQVLDKPGRIGEEPADVLLGRTKAWADEYTQQFRDERPGELAGVNYLALPGDVGADLAAGWRLELSVKLPKDLDRNANAARFAPLS